MLRLDGLKLSYSCLQFLLLVLEIIDLLLGLSKRPVVNGLLLLHFQLLLPYAKPLGFNLVLVLLEFLLHEFFFVVKFIH